MKAFLSGRLIRVDLMFSFSRIVVYPQQHDALHSLQLHKRREGT
jgi:hypothetical protein